MTHRLLATLLLAATALSAAENSPLAYASTAFLRQQATSAIHWQPWTDAVLAQAKQQPKCVYVFIGSPLSELSRATINQTFASEKTIAWLNDNFFCIFVDADAQPEVAAYGQYFITTVKQLKGSPIHLWLTPDTLQLYDGANYLPPSEEWGKAGFLKSARSALDAWTADPTRARALATEAIAMMTPPPLTESKVDLNTKLDQAAAAWIANLDPKNGGFGSAPKLPEPELIRFLLKRDKVAQDAALNAARALVNGATRDRVDGGFYRRCIDDEWKEPYFQKTLADQARIALALFDAAAVAKDDKLRAAGIGALDFALKELRNLDGTFAAALDGTLEENADPAKRPKFVRVGSAPSSSLGLLGAAMLSSGDKRFRQMAGGLFEQLPKLSKQPMVLGHAAGSDSLATAADLIASILIERALKENGSLDTVLAAANDRYFDSKAGAYMASPANLPMGIAVRAPASGDTPSAEVLALLAGVDQKIADLIRRNLLTQIEYDDLPPGDVLLGLGTNR